jgi:hypothetical protein
MFFPPLFADTLFSVAARIKLMQATLSQKNTICLEGEGFKPAIHLSKAFFGYKLNT